MFKMYLKCSNNYKELMVNWTWLTLIYVSANVFCAFLVCICTSRVWICSFSSLFSSCSVFRAISSSGPKQWVIGQRAADQPSAACLATIFSTLFSDRPKGGAAHSRGSPLGQTHTTPAPHFTRRLRGWVFRLFLISGGGRQSRSPGFSGWAAKSNITCCILWVCWGAFTDSMFIWTLQVFTFRSLCL